ncbi:putative GTPase [Pirellulimonas nuda]|uniref:Putative GTPase n=1 Tax=Pirellulimonas nuda TaxID=2528009 RepID=A0A518DFX9_9BACT|nr:methylmalonyl Co-A mutase-associated GTPase MeaB [Pirellulimonas nuda]QDU90369.1 putative GTPase [Pirellulimonas nuda]
MTDPSPAKRRPLSLDEYFEGVRAGAIATLARAITLIESTNPQHAQQAEALLTRLMPHTGGAVRVGITGPPGAGKSTFIEALGLQLIAAGRRVAVLAIDPSSSLSGGSILGDKTRMPRLAAEPGAYIRPTAAAGTLGGTARRTRESLLLCEAAGYDVVLVETVGVGQSEALVSRMTDCVLALAMPGAGDDLQAIKRGLLEVVDIVAVNKADGALLPAAEVTAGQLRNALASGDAEHDALGARVLLCSALENRGVDAVWQAVEQHCAHAKQTGALHARRAEQLRHWLWERVDERLCEALHAHPAVRALRTEIESAVTEGRLSASEAAGRVLLALGLEDSGAK